MKLYKKYFFIELLKYFCLIFFVITSIVCVVRMINYIKYITYYGLDAKNFILIMFFIISILLPLIIPITMVITIIFVYNKYIDNNEINILQNINVTKFQIFSPILYLNIIILVIMLYLNCFFLPNINIKYSNIVQYMKNNIINLITQDKNFNIVKNITFSANKEDLNVLNNAFFFIRATSNKEKDKIIYAQKAKIINNIIKLYNGNIQEFTLNNNNEIKFLFFKKYNIRINDFYDLNISNLTLNKLDFLSIKKLLKIKDKNNKIKIEIINRFVNSFLTLFLSLMSYGIIINKKFSRFKNLKYMFFVYFLSIVIFVINLFCIKSSIKYDIFFIFELIFISLIIIISFFLIKTKKYV